MALTPDTSKVQGSGLEGANTQQDVHGLLTRPLASPFHQPWSPPILL